MHRSSLFSKALVCFIFTLMTNSFFPAHGDDQSELDQQHIRNMAGCYLVDYSYSEVESLRPDYQIDPRVYDSSKKMNVKELVKVVEDVPGKIRLQHFLLATKNGQALFIMRHHAEIWEYAPQYQFVYQGRFEGEKGPFDHWKRITFAENETQGKWIRKITSLDDGLRYQMLGSWSRRGEYPKWSGAAFSPIPGRETRDMGRKDYNTLERDSELTIYPGSWLERQENTKIEMKLGERIPLAREVGKHWYIPLPESECTVVGDWSSERQDFWNILANVWDGVYSSPESEEYKERLKVAGLPRYALMSTLREKYYHDIRTDEIKAQAARIEILKAIQKYQITQ